MSPSPFKLVTDWTVNTKSTEGKALAAGSLKMDFFLLRVLQHCHFPGKEKVFLHRKNFWEIAWVTFILFFFFFF